MAVLDPIRNRDYANPFVTPLKILPERYFYSTFQLLRIVPNKLLGVFLITTVLITLLGVPYFESVNKFQNPLRRPISMVWFFFGITRTIWLGIGATFSIDNSLSLGIL